MSSFRSLFTLKSYVRNKTYPEGSIAEGYLVEECLTFCSRYLSNIETKFNRPVRNDDHMAISLDKGISTFSSVGRPLGKKRKRYWNVKRQIRIRELILDDKTLIQAHRYVLFNCDTITPSRREHEAAISRKYRHLSRRPSQKEIAMIHSRTFHEWFRDYVKRLDADEDKRITDQIRWLAYGPKKVAQRYTGYIVNGFRFHTKDHEKNLTTQNSGLVVNANTMSYASTRDNRPIEGEVTYYGILKDIIELNYNGKYNFVLFKCDWVDVTQGRGCKMDKFGCILVNFGHLIHDGTNVCDDPFILASQAKKVFYVKDLMNEGWHVVLYARVRDLYDMDDKSVEVSIESYTEEEQHNENVFINTLSRIQESETWIRDDINMVDEDEELIAKK